MSTICTYNGNFAAELILDLPLLDGIGSFLLDDLEELLDTHLGELGGYRLSAFACVTGFGNVTD